MNPIEIISLPVDIEERVIPKAELIRMGFPGTLQGRERTFSLRNATDLSVQKEDGTLKPIIRLHGGTLAFKIVDDPQDPTAPPVFSFRFFTSVVSSLGYKGDNDVIPVVIIFEPLRGGWALNLPLFCGMKMRQFSANPENLDPNLFYLVKGVGAAIPYPYPTILGC